MANVLCIRFTLSSGTPSPPSLPFRRLMYLSQRSRRSSMDRWAFLMRLNHILTSLAFRSFAPGLGPGSSTCLSSSMDRLLQIVAGCAGGGSLGLGSPDHPLARDRQGDVATRHQVVMRTNLSAHPAAGIVDVGDDLIYELVGNDAVGVLPQVAVHVLHRLRLVVVVRHPTHQLRLRVVALPPRALHVDGRVGHVTQLLQHSHAIALSL